MFDSSNLDLAQYTPVGDIAVMAMSIIMGILLRQSYISSSRQRFHLLTFNLLAIVIASASNIFYQMLLNSSVLVPALIYFFRGIHCVLMSVVLLLYIQYLNDPLWIPQKSQKHYLRHSVVLIVIIITADIIGSLTGIGFRVTSSGNYNDGINPYIILYALFMGTIFYMLIKYRSRLLRQVFVGMMIVNGLSILMLVVQEFHYQVSYTSLSYFFPIIGIIFMFHSNPYDIDTGAVESSYFFEEVRENISKNNEMLIMCCSMTNFKKAIANSPEIKAEFYKFFRQNVKKGVLYNFPDDRLVLTQIKNRNLNYEEIIRKMLEDFTKSHELFNIDYKITILESSDSIVSTNDYYNLIEYSESRRPFNSIYRLTPEDIKEYYDKNYILSQLRDIAERKDLTDPRVLVFCQPVFNINTGKYDTAEALMRLKLDKIGMVFPDQFIPIAEQFNIIHTLSLIILNKTCFAVRGFIEDGYELNRISVNFSTLDIRQDSFCDEVKHIIERNGIEYDKIAVEITESRSEADFNLMKDRVTQLQNLGIKLYLDDFGTGYSNFERIMEIPFDIIKFDRSLLVESLKSDSSKYMVKTFANMFHDLRYSVLFEGVENEHEEDRCIKMKAQYLQGYKYSKPIPINDLRKFLSRDFPANEHASKARA